MTPHEIIAGLLAGIDDAEGSGPVWGAELLAAAREYLQSPEDVPAPLPEPDLSEPSGGAAIEGGASAPPSGRHKDQPVVQGLVSLVDVYQAQLARALGEGAGLREALQVASAWIDDRVAPWGYTESDATEFHRDRDEQVGRANSALASTPLSKLAGEVLEAVVRLQQSESWAEFWNAQSDPRTPEEWLAVGRTVDALRAELAREGGDGG